MTVTQRQHLLAYLGYYRGSIDGDWGDRSRAACIAFQQDREITADGFGGAETDTALRYAVANDLIKAEQGREDWWEEIRYFTPSEIACKCGQHHTPYCNGFPYRMQKQTMQIADRARIHFGKPITVVSGLRCRRHNADSGGVENSQHLYGEALDLQVRGESQQKVLSWFLGQPDVRYAYGIAGSSNVHFDIQPVGR